MWSTDKEWGMFGFMHEDHFYAAFFWFGLSSGFWGNAGYVLCLVFFSPVVVSISFLIEPVIGQMMGYWLGIDEIPGALTWIGTFIVLAGILAISYADKQRKTDI